MNTSSTPLFRVVTVLISLGFLLLGPQLRAADAAPAWKLQDINGKTVQLSDFKGKVVILDFWATWCPPCRAEIPHFVELQKAYADKGLVIVGISLDQGGVDTVAPFAKANGINYPIVLGDEELTSKYGGIEGIPTTFIVDQKGNIVNKFVGFTEKSVFEDEIKKLLPAK